MSETRGTGMGITPQARRERREQILAWLTTGVAGLYCVWAGTVLWRSSGAFGAMFEGLGAELPTPTRIVVEHGYWIYPLVFGGVAVGLVVKERLVTDKRLSTIITCLTAILVQWLAQWFIHLHYLPLFDIIKKLS